MNATATETRIERLMLSRRAERPARDVLSPTNASDEEIERWYYQSPSREYMRFRRHHIVRDPAIVEAYRIADGLHMRMIHMRESAIKLVLSGHHTTFLRNELVELAGDQREADLLRRLPERSLEEAAGDPLTALALRLRGIAHTIAVAWNATMGELLAAAKQEAGWEEASA